MFADLSVYYTVVCHDVATFVSTYDQPLVKKKSRTMFIALLVSFPCMHIKELMEQLHIRYEAGKERQLGHGSRERDRNEM